VRGRTYEPIDLLGRVEHNEVEALAEPGPKAHAAPPPALAGAFRAEPVAAEIFVPSAAFGRAPEIPFLTALLTFHAFYLYAAPLALGPGVRPLRRWLRRGAELGAVRLQRAPSPRRNCARDRVRRACVRERFRRSPPVRRLRAGLGETERGGITPKSWTTESHRGVLHLGKRWYVVSAEIDERGRAEGVRLDGPYPDRESAESRAGSMQA